MEHERVHCRSISSLRSVCSAQMEGIPLRVTWGGVEGIEARP